MFGWKRIEAGEILFDRDFKLDVVRLRVVQNIYSSSVQEVTGNYKRVAVALNGCGLFL